MFAALLPEQDAAPLRPSTPTQPRPRGRKHRGGAAARAVASLLSEIPAVDVLRDRGAADSDLDALLRRLARRGRSAEGCTLLLDRRCAVVEYGARKRIKGRALTAALRTLHGIPLPEAAVPTPRPDIGRISAPERLPTRRWGYRCDNVWWSSRDAEGVNGFTRISDPVAIQKLDRWALERFPHLHPSSAGESPAPALPAQFESLAAASTVQGDLLSGLGEADDARMEESRARNYRITRDEGIGTGSPRRKAAANLDAIRLLALLEAEARHPTVAEQAVLARYCGWGALPGVFDDQAPEWEQERTELRALLTQAELASAEASTPNAHFTSITVIDGIYGMLARLGFRGGRILEAGAGVGHFIGCVPDAIAARSHWTAVESDLVTGRILAHLYPQEDIRVTGFEHADVADGRYDAVVGNVPFGSYTIHDPEHNPDNDFRVHDYFIVRALAALRPGGLLVAITSRGTLDKSSRKARERMASMADLLGAVRLPNTAFQANAGTLVTSDILVLRRRAPAEPAGGHPWLDSVAFECADGPLTINQYFADHPSMMLGEMRLVHGLHSPNEPTLAPRAGGVLAQELAAAAESLPADVYVDRAATEREKARDALADLARGLREGKFTEVRGRLYQKSNGTLASATLGRKDLQRVAALTRICAAVRHVLQTQNEEHPQEDQDAARAVLNHRYDAFVAKFGCINRERHIRFTRPDGQPGLMVRRPNLQAYRSDPDWPLVAALEVYDSETDTAAKAAIFTQRVVRPVVEITQVDNVVDALLVCLDRRARVDLKFIGQLWGDRSAAKVRSALAGRIYRDPHTGRWETAETYLSGPVRSKLEAARTAAQQDPKYLANVAALEKVQPPDLEPSQIDCPLGASWVPTDVIAHFVRELLGRVAETATIDVVHFAREGTWRVKAPPAVRESIEATRTWGTERADAIELLENALNQRETRVYDYPVIDGKKVRTINVVATVDAQEKQRSISDRYEAWVWSDGARAKRLLTIYNTVFNGTRLPTYDGSHLSFPGASEAIVLDPHQVNAVWRILTSGNTLVAHCVGAGKTYLAAAAGMKLRQVGLAQKVVHVVMNHLLEQYSRETLQFYPNARLLVAGADDLVGDGRRLFLARVAEGDFDAIIITHGAFGKLPMSRAFQEDFLRKEIASYRALLNDCDPDDRLTIKEINSALLQMEARLQHLMARTRKDAFLTFEELGVDCVFVDEIQQFKNLDTPTKIVGIPKASPPSQRATGLLMKAIFLDRIRPGRGLIGMTGTPISNTIAEIHVMARLHARHLLARLGIDHFDGFAGTFIRRVNAPELAPDGKTYRIRTRFHFQNVAELSAMFRTFADVQMMRSYYEAPDGETFEGGTLELPIPKLAGGKPEVIAAEPTPALRRYIDWLVRRVERIRSGAVKQSQDNMLSVVTDGRKAALDMRLIDPDASDWAGSKLNLCAREVHRTWMETADRRLTQLVFTDLSRPRRDGRFSVCNDLRNKLIALGIPEGEIAFAQDASTDARKAMLFKAVREGRVRVLIGSTETMGTGTNVQDRLIRIHHLDAPWRPADIEQRDGRMMRRGNLNPVCWITRYVTKESFDAYVWNLLHYKLTMINRVMLGDLSIRRVNEGDGVELSYAQVRAIATGNPLILEKAAVDQRVLILSRARWAFGDARIRSSIDRVEIPQRIVAHQDTEAALLADLAVRQDTRGALFSAELQIPRAFSARGRYERFDRRPEAAARLRRLLVEFVERGDISAEIGSFAGFAITVVRHRNTEVELALRGRLAYSGTIDLNATTAAGNLQVLENLPRRMEAVLDSTRQRIVYLQQQLETLAAETEEFPGEAEYQRLLARQREIDRALEPAKDEAAALRAAAAAQDEEDADETPPPMAEAA